VLQTRRTPPAVFFFLILPYGTSFGFVSVALPFIAAQRGISVDAISGVVALAFAPHGYKFLWAPLVDTTLTRKTWFSTAVALVAAGTFASAAMPIAPESIGALTAVVIVSQLGLTFLAMTCQALMGNCLLETEKGRAAGWYQAGAFVGGGAGGGAALWLSQRLAGWQAGAVLAGAMALTTLALRWVREPPVGPRPTLREAVRSLAGDLKRIVTSSVGLTGLLICLLPIGAGAASNLFGALALTWHASAHVVELATGVLGGVASAGGAMIGGWLADRMNRRVTFAMGGGLTALAAVAMALGPETAAAYVVFTLAYQIAAGLSRAAFIGFVLETVGTGAVATKYAVFASLLNIAILYTTRLEGAAAKRWGPQGLLLADAAFTVAGIAVLLVIVALMRRRARS
jgi:hypothetical protein